VVIGTYSGAIASRGWDNETFNVNLPWGTHTLAVLVNCTAPPAFVCTEIGDPTVWTTIKEDIAGTFFLGNSVPDIKVDIQDVARASGAFGGLPGQPKWNAVVDQNNDYKIDIQDLARISAKFGWHSGIQ